MSSKLKNYPLYPYLEYSRLRYTLSSQKTATIANFTKKYADTPLPKRLQQKWLYHLAKSKQWLLFQQHYNQANNNTALRCHYLASRLHKPTKADLPLFQEITKLWLNAKSQPKSCDPVFKYWVNNGGLSNDLAWQRIELAMAVRERHLVRYLKKFVNKQEQKYVDLWLRLDLKPHLVTKARLFNFRHPAAAKIKVHALKRLTQKNEDQAIAAWKIVKATNSLNQQQRGDVLAQIGLLLALRNHQDASSWLKKIPATHVDDAIHEWRVRNAINNQDWSEVSYWINRQPQALRQDDTWQYWQARAADKLENPREAYNRYELLAKDLNYYGLLASERIEAEYPISRQTAPSQDADTKKISTLPGIKRARELYALHKLGDARREWEFTTRQLNTKQQLVAARLAKSWGWYDRVISTSQRANIDKDPDLLFPMANSHYIINASKLRQINPAWIFSIARQESHFISDARSPIGALGIMQILPATAWSIAKEKNIRYRGRSNLLDAKININLGTAYLRKMADLYQENVILTAAAYNAGPRRVKQWLPKSGTIAADVWIDTIPYAETRKYLKNVLTNIIMYEHKLGQNSKLSDYMDQIKAAPS